MAQTDIPCVVLRPQTVKQAVGYFGNVSKKDVMIAVKWSLRTRFETLKSNHAADVCAVAMTGILKERC